MDVLAVGDTTEDIFLQLHDASLQCSVDGKNCMLSLDYGEKIAVERKTIVSAVGNAANHAIGAARLGCKAALYTVLGDDDQGHHAKDILEKNGVDTQFVTFDKEHGTNLSVIINFRSERTILVYHEPREYSLPSIDHPAWIYLTSASGKGVETLHTQVLQHLASYPDCKMAFNPGTHQIHLGKDELLPLLQKTSLLFLNREEAARVSEVETRDIKVLMQAFHKMGIGTVVITDGPEGSYASDGRQIYHLERYPVTEVERTGAGDAYGSGFLSAIINKKGIPEAMQWGGANAASVVQYIGAREGLLEQTGITHMIQEYANISPRVFDTI
jgi:ribokinase